MTNLISQAFRNNQKKLITFVTGGDPDFETSLEIINSYPNNISGWVAYKNACKLTQREDDVQLAVERINDLSSIFKESSDN